MAEDRKQGPAEPASAGHASGAPAQQFVEGARRALTELGDRRGLRIVILGAVLVLIALFAGMDSALTIPILIVGGLMIAIGSLGPRLSGRFAIEFGASGTVIEMRTEVTPPGTVASEHNRRLPLPATVEQAEAQADEPQDAEVIEGTGETIEIDVAELEALVEAAQNNGDGSSDRVAAPPSGSAGG